MADLSKIKLNNTEYNLKDAIAREDLANLPFCMVYAYHGTTLELNDELFLTAEPYGESPYENAFWYGHPRLIILEIHDGEVEDFGIYFAIMKSYKLRLYQLDGDRYFEGANVGSNWSGNTSVFYKGENSVTIPTVESMANVEAMLTSLGLDASINLQSAAAGTTETDRAVVQKGVSS